MASFGSNRRSQLSNISSATDSAGRGVLSHPVSNCELDTPSTTPQSGSPTSENGSHYSPKSQPFGERPPVRTSAGAAVRQSISNLPSPPPFTPTTSMEQTQTVEPPVPFGMAYSGGSCGSSAHAAGLDTPGVTSGWAGSSTKAAASEDTFAFRTAPTRDSPDVETFGAAAPAPDVPLGLQQRLLQAAQHMAASQDPDATSESSSVSRASRSSSSWRDSHGGVSPGDLLRKAKGVIERSAAIGGSSRLPRNKRKSNPLQTPLEKNIPQTTTPQNTPMDVESGQFEDQQSLLAVSHASVVAPVMPIMASPTSATPTSKGAAAAALDTADKGSPVQRISQASTADSHASEVSIGSVCATPTSLLAEADASASRRLDFNDAASEMGAATPQAATGSHNRQVGASQATELPASPMPLDRLCKEMQSPTSRKFFSDNKLLEDSAADEALNDDFTFAVHHAAEAAAVVETAEARAALFSMPPVAPAHKPSRARRAGSAVLWGLAGLGLVFMALVAVELLPQQLQAPPGAWCTGNNADACLRAGSWWDQQLDKDVKGWKLVIKRASYYVIDAWDIVVHHKYPPGVRKEDAIQAILKHDDLALLEAMPVEQAVQLFGGMSRDILPQVIISKLEASEAAAAGHMVEQPPPEELLAVSSSGAAPADNVLQVDTAADATTAVVDSEAAETSHETPVTEPMVEDQLPAPAMAEDDTVVDVPVADTSKQEQSAAAIGEGDIIEVPAAAQEQELGAELDRADGTVIEVPEAAAQEQVLGAELDRADGTIIEVPEAAAQEQEPGAELDRADGTIIEVPVAEADEQPAAAAEATAASAELSALDEVQPAEEAVQPSAQSPADEQLAEEPGVEGVDATEAAALQAPVEGRADPQAADKQLVEAADDEEAATVAESIELQVSVESPADPQVALEQQPAVEPEQQMLMQLGTELVSTESAMTGTESTESATSRTEEVEQSVPKADAVGSFAELLQAKVLQATAGVALLMCAAVAAFMYLPALLAQSVTEESEAQQAAEGQDEAAGQQQDMAVARKTAAVHTLAARASPFSGAAADADANAGLLSDEEGEPASVQAVEQAGLAAGLFKLLTPVAKPPPPSVQQGEAAAGPSARAAGRTPRATRSGGIAGALTRRPSTRSASQLAAAAEEDGEEVQQPASTGRRRVTATPRNRKSVAAALQPVPEQQQADATTDEGGLLSDEEPAPRARNKRRQSAPAAAAAAAAAPSGGGRRKSAAPALNTGTPATPVRATRRNSKQL